MPPTIRTGALSAAGTMAINSDQRVVDMMEQVFEYDPPGASPLLTIVTKRAQVTAAELDTVKHLEDEPLPEWDLLNGSISSGTNQIVVDNPDYHRPGDILKVTSTGETMRVSAVNSGTSTLTVVRSWGATAASAAADNAWVLNLGPAEMEGDLSPQAKATITVTKFNYTQIFKEPVHITKTGENARLYGGNERMRQRKKAGAVHARNIEQAFLHGEKNIDTSGAYPVRSMGGLDEHITTNVLAVGGALTKAAFDSWLGAVFRYGVKGMRKSKILYASNELCAAISAWAGNQLVTNSEASARYGIRVTTYISPHGDLQIINHPLLEFGYAGSGYVVDIDGVYYRPYRRTQLETNIQAPGEDAFKDQYITECTASFALEKAFGKITGVTA